MRASSTERGDWIAYVPFALRRIPTACGSRRATTSARSPTWTTPAARRPRHAARTTRSAATTGSGRHREPGYLFPYLLWFHQAPATGGDEWHVHAHTAPPLRAPGVQRFVASGELGSGTLANPVVPEEAARALRAAIPAERVNGASARRRAST